jgi:hypothetical protein
MKIVRQAYIILGFICFVAYTITLVMWGNELSHDSTILLSFMMMAYFIISVRQLDRQP